MGGRNNPDLLLFTEENQWALGNVDYEWAWLAVTRVHLSAVYTFKGGGKGVLTISRRKLTDAPRVRRKGSD